jgi:hypothetical protein
MNNMIKFIDINTGNVYDGCKPYTHWFPGEQSINLFYTHHICFISNSSSVAVKIEKNDVFQLLNPDSINSINSPDIINGDEYWDISKLICKDPELKLNGINVHEYYIYNMYITAKTNFPGSYICSFYIDDEEFKIGADFYGEEESLYINLSNNGLELPGMIQKAFYTSNVHEDNRDNILINRKFKELLSNYWDILTCQGSYKSLYNSLKWFEYGDMVKLYEIWSFNNGTNHEQYFEKDLQLIMSDKYSAYFNHAKETTYIALGLALQQLSKNDDKVLWGEDGNPVLEQISSKWSINDLSLKMSMLGNFYEYYFTPIHVDLIRSTIEDIVYSDTFKILCNGIINRSDYVYELNDISCNINDNDVFPLGIVKCWVGKDTMFGVSADGNIENNKITKIIGVQRTIPTVNNNSDEISTFVSQMYHDVGCIVDFNITTPLIGSDKIKKEYISITCKDSDNQLKTKDLTSYNIIKDKNINFSILCETCGDYVVKIQLDTIQGHIYTKVVRFSIIDTQNTKIRIFKIKNDNKDHTNWTMDDNINNYYTSMCGGITGLTRFDERNRVLRINSKFQQYIPAYIPEDNENNDTWAGIKLNHMVVIKGTEMELSSYITDNYICKPLTKGNKDYMVCISKKFNFKPDKQIIKSYPVYKSKYVYLPEYHTLEELGWERGNRKEHIKYYTIDDCDALCVIPDISFSKYINNYTWEFVNVSDINNKKTIKLKTKEPFISNLYKKQLDPGYYDIVFKYSLRGSDYINEIRWESAFLKK